MYYRPELDVLRLLAFLMVFAHHLPRPEPLSLLWNAQIAGGSGVCIFFVLSAYLLTELLTREREKTGSIHVPAFFIRRVLRIWPLYFFAIALALALGHWNPDWRPSSHALPYLLLLGGNFWVARAGWASLGLLGPLWSLSIEEQFYLVIPTLAKFGSRQALRWASWVCLAAAYTALVWLGRHHVEAHTGVWVNSFVQFQFFAVGTLLSMALHGRRWRPGLPLRGALLLLGLVALLLAQKSFGALAQEAVPPSQLIAGYLMILTGCLCLFLAFLEAPMRFPRALTYLGHISYGLYMYHAFVLGIIFGIREHPTWSFALRHPYLADVGALTATILLAAASYHLFEQRILRLKERFAFVKSGAEGAPIGEARAG